MSDGKKRLSTVLRIQGGDKILYSLPTNKPSVPPEISIILFIVLIYKINPTCGKTLYKTLKEIIAAAYLSSDHQRGAYYRI